MSQTNFKDKRPKMRRTCLTRDIFIEGCKKKEERMKVVHHTKRKCLCGKELNKQRGDGEEGKVRNDVE